jgi:phage baseplate assembly protein W
MAKGISPKLPLSINSEDGKYALNKTLKDTVQQNLKNLILTVPGERIMDPKFGVGLNTFLFEQNTPFLKDDIRGRIMSQVEKYLPFVEIQQITMITSDDDPVNVQDNGLWMTISYFVVPLGQADILELNV